jgi:hypothetical protein
MKAAISINNNSSNTSMLIFFFYYYYFLSLLSLFNSFKADFIARSFT